MGYPHFSGDCDEHHDLVRDFGPGNPARSLAFGSLERAAAGRANRPRIVCLCGSTRFIDEFQRANLERTLAGEIVLTIGCDTKSDADPAAVGAGIDKAALDELHKRKIDLADYVLVLNVGGYIGDSTRSEVEYARAHHKPVEWLESGHD